jgi:hypothetical protein
MVSFVSKFLVICLILPAISFADVSGFSSSTLSKIGGKTFNPCEISFVKLLNGKIPAEIRGNAALNMWDERFAARYVIKEIEELPNKQARLSFLEDLKKLIHKEQIYVDNMSSVVNEMVAKNLISLDDVKRIFLKKKVNNTNFFYSLKRKELSGKIGMDQDKVWFVDDLIKKSNLTANLRKEYTNILMHSNRSIDELEKAVKAGMKLHNDYKSMEQFRLYMEFLDSAKAPKVAKGLKNVEKIYDYNYAHAWYTPDLVLSPQKQFLAQKSRLKKFEGKRLAEVELGYKMQSKEGIEILDEIVKKEKMGIKVTNAEKRAAKKKVEELQLSKEKMKSAVKQAKGERNIFRKLMNGCSSGNSKRLRSAATKFKRFKIALAVGGTPLFYWMKNKDKLGEDDRWFEKLGYEMAIGLAFTFVGNKIITNGNTSFLKKYITGYGIFGAMDGVSALGYDALFGKNSYIRYFQQIYRGGDLKPSEVEAKFEELKKSPTFEKDMKELFAYLEEKSKQNNTMNFLNKYVNLNTYASGDDPTKITQEDLETAEGEEMMMELLAERMYLQNMGEWPIFQTGNKGADRWAFYRARNVVWDLKGIALNLAIFQIMCREPLGKVGSWGLILGLVLGDQFYSGDLTYGARREAINQ